MTYYLGSKANYAEELLAIMLSKRKPGAAWVEPFVGGANVICRVPDVDGPRIGADINPYMIALHTALRDGWDPPHSMDEKTYTAIRKNPKKYPMELVGFAGTGCTFGSLWLDVYARNDKGHPDRCSSARAYALKDVPGLKGAKFVCSSYDQLEIPPDSLIYCDVPYVGTAGYMDEHQTSWRAYKFWQWADRMVDNGHTVFVSEYKGPQAEVYPTPPRTEAHNAVMVELKALQADMQALGDAPTPADMVAKREDLASRLAEHDAARRAPCEVLAARWKVVWEKRVKVGLNAVGTDKRVNEEVKSETEKLFHREA